MFVHFSFIHIALNMWALWDVGRLLERLLGRWRYAVLYLGAGAVGNLLSLVVQGNRAVSGGASGAADALTARFRLNSNDRMRLGVVFQRRSSLMSNWVLGRIMAFTSPNNSLPD